MATETQKMCRYCGETHPLSKFKSGNICTDCHLQKHYEKRKVEDAIHLANNAKKCGGPCGKTLPTKDFAWFNKEEKILQQKCRICYNAARRRRPDEEDADENSGSDTQPRPAKRPRIDNSVASGMTHKYCKYHECEHPVEDFSVRNDHYKSCKKADQEKAKARRKKTKKAEELMAAVESGAVAIVQKVPPKKS